MSAEVSPKAALAAALAKANTEVCNPAFDKQNPHFKSKFASLAAVRNAVIPIYAKYGLSVLQDLQSVEGGVACYTTILHASGERETFGPLVMPITKQDAQGYASAGTYAKRVHLQAVACVVGDEDDDAEAAVGRGNDHKTDPRPEGWKAADTRKATADAKRLIDAATEAPHTLKSIWDELKADEVYASAVWQKLPNPVKDTIKETMRAA